MSGSGRTQSGDDMKDQLLAFSSNDQALRDEGSLHVSYPFYEDCRSQQVGTSQTQEPVGHIAAGAIRSLVATDILFLHLYGSHHQDL